MTMLHFLEVLGSNPLSYCRLTSAGSTEIPKPRITNEYFTNQQGLAPISRLY